MPSKKIDSVYLEIGVRRAPGEPKKTLKKIQNDIKREKLTATIQVLADTARARADIHNLKRSIDAMRATIHAQVTADSARARAEIAELAKQRIHIPATVEANTERARAALRALTKERYTATITANLDARSVRNELRNLSRGRDFTIRPTVLRDSLEHFKYELRRLATAHIKIPVTLTTNIQKVREELRRLANERIHVPILARVHSKAAQLELALVTRPRIAEIHARVSNASIAASTAKLGAVQAAASALSSIKMPQLSMFTGLAGGVLSLVAAFTKLAVVIPPVVTGIGSLGAAATGGVAHILTLGKSLGVLGGAILAMPSLAAPFAAAIGVWALARQEQGTFAREMAEANFRLSGVIVRSFWLTGQYQKALRNFALEVENHADKAVGHFAASVGELASAMLNAATARGPELLEFIHNMGRFMHIASTGAGNLANALINVLTAGGRVLPDIARGFNDVAIAINTWTSSADLEGMIRRSFDAIKDLLRLTWNLVGVFDALTKAAEAAGGTTLKGFTDGVERLNQAMHGEFFQGAMTTVFKGALDAMRELAPGVRALGVALGNMAPHIATVFTKSAQVFSQFLVNLTKIIDNSGFQQGISMMFDGFKRFAEGLEPMMAPLGELIGNVAGLFGRILGIVGPLVGQLAGTLLPVFNKLWPTIHKVVDALGNNLQATITPLLPHLETLGKAFGELAEVYLEAVIKGLEALKPHLPAIADALGKMAATVGESLADALKDVLPDLVKMAAEAIPQLADAIIELLPDLTELLKTFVKLSPTLVKELFPIILELAKTAVPIFTIALQALLPFVTDLLKFVLEIIKAMGSPDDPNSLSGVLVNIFKAIQDFLKEHGPGFVQFFKDVSEKVEKFSQEFTKEGGVLDNLKNLSEKGTEAFNNVKGAFEQIGTVMGNFVSSIAVGFATAVLTVRQKASEIKQGVENAWNTAVSSASNALAEMVRVVSQWWNNASQTVQNWGRHIGQTAQNIWQTVSNHANIMGQMVQKAAQHMGNVARTIGGWASGLYNNARNAFQGVVNGAVSQISQIAGKIGNQAQHVYNAVRGLGNRAAAAIQGFGNHFRSAGVNMIQGLINGVASGASALYDTIRNLARNAIGVAKRMFRIHSPSRVFMEIGKYVSEGLAVGIDNAANLPQKAIDNLVNIPTKAQIKLPTLTALNAPNTTFGGATGENSPVKQLDITEAMTRMYTTVTEYMPRLVAALEPIGQAVKQVATTFSTDLPQGAAQAVPPLQAALMQIQTAAAEVAKNVKLNLLDEKNGLFGAIKVVHDIGYAMFLAFYKTYGKVMLDACQVSLQVVKNIVEYLGKAPVQTYKIGTAMRDNLVATFGRAVLRACQISKKVVNTIVIFMGPAAEESYKIGVGVVQGFIDGIENNQGALNQVMRNMAVSAANSARRALKINSPSKVFMQIGGYVSEGFAVGIQQKEQLAHTALNKLIAAPNQALPPLTPPAPPIGAVAPATTATAATTAPTTSNSDTVRLIQLMEDIRTGLDRVVNAVDIKLDGRSVVTQINRYHAV